MTTKTKTTTDRRHRYACANCGAAGDRQWIAAMDAAGFALRHLACPECGQHTLRDRKEILK